MLFHPSREEATDTIAEIKYIRYPNFATDSSKILLEANGQIQKWVEDHAEGMNAGCNGDLRVFADQFRTGGPFMIYIDHKILKFRINDLAEKALEKSVVNPPRHQYSQ